MPWKPIKGRFNITVEPGTSYKEVQILTFNCNNLENLWGILEIQKFILIKTKYSADKMLIPTNRILEVHQSEEYWCDECGKEKLTWSDHKFDDGLCSKCRDKQQNEVASDA